MEDRRHFTRLPFDHDAVIHTEGAAYTAHLEDISIHGALLKAPLPAPFVGQTLELELTLDNLTLHFETNVAEMHEGKLGLVFVQTDVDTLVHLRRLLELNLGDADLVERDLEALFAPHL